MPELKDYRPSDFEESLSADDLKHKRYASRADSGKKPYTIVMPPPNVTGMLHMGHILNNTVQDVLIRYKRMDGYEACWIPGLDHASIATESKVTQWLESQNINKFDIGREKFLEYAMQWKEQYGGIINDQLKRLGASADWDRERFTMDEDYSREVLQAFVDLYNEGLVYKGFRLVNWCPKSKSAISDDEVEHIEEDGFLWQFSYPVKDMDEVIVIATTRPETMFGDTAVMVHPDDARYKHLIGGTAVLPMTGREIPIIADDYVDMEFGTGAVKVTPAHDPNDYEVGRRHGLEMISVMGEDGRMNSKSPELFIGLDRFEARALTVEEMDKLGLLVSVKPHLHKVGYSQRGQVPIEPMLSEQWFISMKELAAPAKKAVEDGEIAFHPPHWTKTYYHWLDNIKDWCISRQLWWGHRIPVYTCESCAYQAASVEHLDVCPKCGGVMRQEEDVLDTWASSWLWSYAVNRTKEDMDFYHPTDTLVTGPDIIFFWVARMVMAALHFKKEIPFRDVYFTGIIRDDIGRKMSKSLGNSPDPMDVMDAYGADALRFSVVRLAPVGNDILYSDEKVDLGKRFANKIWNAAKFISAYTKDKDGNEILDPKTVISDNASDYILDDFDKSILSRFNASVDAVRHNFDRFRLNDVAREIYDFIWGEFCDKYVENSKPALLDSSLRENKLKMLLFMFKRILKMLHPLMPFITEQLYREVFGKEAILFESYPVSNPNEVFAKEDALMKRFDQCLYMIREIRAESNVPPSATPKAAVSANEKDLFEFFSRNKSVIQKLARLSDFDVVSGDRALEAGEATALEYDFQVFVDLKGSIDKDKEIERLQKETDRLAKAEKSVSAKLGNPQFTEKAPAEVIKKEQAKLDEITAELQKTRESLSMWTK